MTEPGTPTFSERLLAWWDRHGRKDLPWQHPRTPYRVWVSEIMLQQTQVTTVIPYFERWMTAFPDLETLAGAPLDEVLSHWSGLGYYARARNLHRAAALCMEHHDGRLPEAAEELVELPGIGESTANAIVSQSTDRPAAVLDGNVRRVLARHAAVDGWTGGSAVQKRLWSEARNRLPGERGADYTQAVMDLGALVCRRSAPGCEACPVSADCRALQLDAVGRLPAPRPKQKVSDRVMHMLLLSDDRGRLLLERRPPAGVWGGLWCLPTGDSQSQIGDGLGLALDDARELKPLEHRLSHLRLDIRPFRAAAGTPTRVECSDRLRWFEPAEAKKMGLPRPVAQLIGRFRSGELE